VSGFCRAQLLTLGNVVTNFKGSTKGRISWLPYQC